MFDWSVCGDFGRPTARVEFPLPSGAEAELLDKRREIDTSIERVKRQIGTTLRKQTAYR